MEPTNQTHTSLLWYRQFIWAYITKQTTKRKFNPLWTHEIHRLETWFTSLGWVSLYRLKFSKFISRLKSIGRRFYIQTNPTTQYKSQKCLEEDPYNCMVNCRSAIRFEPFDRPKFNCIIFYFFFIFLNTIKSESFNRQI